MTDPWTDPADALFTNPDWEDPFPEWEEENPSGWPKTLAGPEWEMASWVAFDVIFEIGTDFYAPRARWVADR